MLQVIAYGLPLTALAGVAGLEQLALPVTPEVPSVSAFLKPLIVAVNAGLASPYSRLALFAVTVRWAFVIVKIGRASCRERVSIAGVAGSATITYGLPATALVAVADVRRLGLPLTPIVVRGS